MRSYNEIYLNDAMISLANAFDYAVNTCRIDADTFALLFVQSGKAKLFETGNPSIISGRSGIELATEIISDMYPDKDLPEPECHLDRSPEYWAGYSLAYYQWYTAKRFKDIFGHVPFSETVLMYPVFHEMDLTNFVESMDKRYNSVRLDTKLKKLREAWGFSQSRLAELSGVSKRSIQLYEQRVNDIDKAQAHTLYKLAHTLGCDVEDLLEQPEENK